MHRRSVCLKKNIRNKEHGLFVENKERRNV